MSSFTIMASQHASGMHQTPLAAASSVAAVRLSARRPAQEQRKQRQSNWVTACAAVSAAIMAKRGRDPEKPKRPGSAWFLFLTDFRKDKANKNLDYKQVFLEASKSWKNLSAAEQKPYEAAAKTGRGVFSKAFKKYKDSGRAEYWNRDPNEPKRPMFAINFFMAEKAEKKQLKQGQQCLAEIWKAWGDLSTAQQKPYMEKQAKAKEAFAKANAAYKASDSEEKWKKDVGIKALEDAEESKRMSGTEKAKALKEKAKAQILKEKEKAKALKAKAKAKAQALKVKEMTKAKALKEKAKAKAQALKTVKKTVIKAVKTTVTKGVEKTAAKKQPVTA